MFDTLAEVDLAALRADIDRRLADQGVRFGTRPFHVDPVPRLLTPDETALLTAGLAQRVAALNAFVVDAYGERAIVQAGVVPERVIDGAEGYEPSLRGRWPDAPLPIGVAGLDIVRDPDGELLVLEDNARTPSGLMYAIAGQAAIEAALPDLATLAPHDDVSAIVDGLGATLRGATAKADPVIAVLSDGTGPAHYEHVEAARALGVAVVTLDDLRHRDERLQMQAPEGWVDVDVVYRRSDEDRLHADDGAPTAVAEALLAPWLAGHLAIVNAFGTGVADDKLAHAYVEEMIRFYLGEEPVLRSLPTLDLELPESRAQVLDALTDHVIKPRFGHGGIGVVVCAHATDDDVRLAGEAIRARPQELVAQPLIWLSHHPTVIDGALAPRHVDLRPFIFSAPDATRVVAGGLTRVAWTEGALVVNSSQNGGSKATWAMRDAPPAV